MLYWRDIKRCYDLKTFIPKVFTELDEKYRLGTVKAAMINLIMIYYS